jgi:hypothetical protein
VTQIKSKQVERILAAPVRLSGLTIATTTSSTVVTTPVTTALSTAGDGGVAVPLQVSSSNGLGVVTTGASNRVEIYLAASKDKILATNGEEVYGRLTEASGIYTLSYFTLPNSGTEAAYTFPAGQSIDAEIVYRFDFARLPTDAIVAMKSRNIADDASGAGGSPFGESIAVTATNTLALLTKTPTAQSTVQLIVNSTQQEPGFDYTISARTITWIPASAGFALATIDRVYALYNTLE